MHDFDFSAGADTDAALKTLLGTTVSGLDISSGFELAGLDISSGEDLMAELVAGAIQANTYADPRAVLSRLPPSVRGKIMQAMSKQKVRELGDFRRQVHQAATQPRIVDPGPRTSSNIPDGIPATVVPAGATALITLQPDVMAAKPYNIHVMDAVADFFSLTVFNVGRQPVLASSNAIPCSLFKSSSVDRKWEWPTARAGHRITVGFQNNDAAAHVLSGAMMYTVME